MSNLPPPVPGTVLRVLATNDMGAALVPFPTSYGIGGTCAGIARMLEEERGRQPTIWLDSGDLAVGAVRPLFGVPWDDIAALPISAGAVGNHEFDEGVPALVEASRSLPFPLLCANAEIGLPGTAVIDTDAGPIGVIGLTHPMLHGFGKAPETAEGWESRVEPLADDLRSQGATWIVALLHDGVDWWPTADGDNAGRPIATRADRLQTVARGWARHADVILGAHTLGAWIGDLDGTPAGHAFPFASSVVVVDCAEPPRTAIVRGPFIVAPARPEATTPAVAALDAAAEQVVGNSTHTWLLRTGAEHYLADFVAEAQRRATGAEAGFVPGQVSSQAPLDGALAALLAGPVTQLDLHRLYNYSDDHLVLIHLERGDWQKGVDRYNAISDPRSTDGDYELWNSCRMPAGTCATTDDPRTVAVVHWVAPRLSRWVGRDLEVEPTDIGGREALVQALH